MLHYCLLTCRAPVAGRSVRGGWGLSDGRLLRREGTVGIFRIRDNV